MPYRASVYRVMVASPGDVTSERRLVAEVVHEWNAIHSKDRRMVMMPVGWDSHASPEMGDRPQAVINRQILQDCDLLVAMFWTRLGSPTGVSASGTVEEIDEHLRAGRPAMIYFSSAPVRLDSVHEQQYTALRQFKDECRKRGLVEEYESLSEFREKFSRQLAQTIIRCFAKDDDVDDVPVVAQPAAVPELSDAARELLREATKDATGTIMCLAMMGGSCVQTNGKAFTEPGNARSEARGRGALKELQNLDLIEDRSYKGEVFSVTDAGYRVAELLA
jgi:hypothetical protein